MKFKVPQFIEKETKIMGPLTFRQFIYIGSGGFLFFIIYSVSAQISSALFMILTIIIIGASFSFAFLKIEGHPLPILFSSFINFITAPRTYLWERKAFVSKISYKKETVPEKKDENTYSDIKIFKQSRLKELSSNIEIKD